MNTITKEFSQRILVFLSIVFVIHVLINIFLNLPKFQHLITEAYVINAMLAIGIFWGLIALKEKYNNQIGFLFLASSFIKFFVFFLVFYGPYKADDQITFSEFVSFFIPYTICLVLETFYLSKKLNQM
ncbi:DUF6168 family protein [Flavobacteriaceae bacterium]|nr:DUF6168 family protein [Flavobacteriaceae bacterium]